MYFLFEAYKVLNEIVDILKLKQFKLWNKVVSSNLFFEAGNIKGREKLRR